MEIHRVVCLSVLVLPLEEVQGISVFRTGGDVGSQPESVEALGSMRSTMLEMRMEDGEEAVGKVFPRG